VNPSFTGSGYKCRRVQRPNIFSAAWLIGTLVLIAPLAAFAQRTSGPARVTDRVDISRMVTLRGNTHPQARAQYDQGAAPADLPMNRMMLLLKRSPDQESALQTLLNEQQVKTSGNFHKWLTPDQFGQQFGVADADIQAVTSWLTSFGFQSIQVSKGRNVIEFSGTAAQVQAGLRTAIHKYVVNGESHWANSSDPQIPAALAPVISGVVSLHDFRHKPTVVKADRKVTANVTSGARGQINLQGQSGTVHAMVPADFNTIYTVGSSMTGNGVTIGVIADTNINVQDVADFRNFSGLATKNPNIILNGPDPGDVPGSIGETEAVLDSAWSGAVAPQATIDLVISEDTNASPGTDLSEFYIIDNNLADVMTESFSACEFQFVAQGQLSAAANFYSAMAEQAAAQGITYVVSSGDGGPDGCDDPSTNPATPTQPSVNILASTPFTLAVGGTMFNDNANPSTYWAATNGVNHESALSYIPENVWNESCTTAMVGQAGCPTSGLWSSGGGVSIAFLTAPPWQAGVTGLPGTHARLVPDVVLNAADHDGYLLCLDGSCQQNPQQFAVASGTSASVQAFGGIMALVVQKVGSRVGLANVAMYKLAGAENYSNCNGSTVPSPGTLGTCIFNDVTVGNTNVPGETGFTAAAGYDETTGLGSVNVTNLVNGWSSAIINATTTALTLNNGNPVSVTHGAAVPVGIVVSPVLPATGTPTGDVSLIANSSTDQGVDGFILSGGAVSSSTNNTILLPGGNYQVHAHYEGDSTFLGSDSAPVTVTVTREPSQINFGAVVTNPQTGACAQTFSVAYGSAYILTVDVADQHVVSTACAPNVTGSSPTGTVTVTDSFNSGAAVPLDGGTFKLNSFGYFEDQTIQLPVGSHAISASYSGDSSFSPPSGPATGTIVVTKAATATAVTASPTSTGAGQPVTLTATISTQSNATASLQQEPTGTVQFLRNGTNFGSSVAVVGGVNQNTLFAQATATLPTSTLSNGANVITAQYSGDSNYTTSSTVSSVTVNIGSSGINVTTCSGAAIMIMTPGQSGSCLLTVTGANGFNGTVTLTSGITSAPPSATHSPTCSFGAPDQNFTAPNTISLNSGSGNATFICATTAASAVLIQPSSRPPSGPLVQLMYRGWPLAGVGVSIACFLVLLAAPKPRRWKLVPLAVLLVVMGATLVSCGSGGGGEGTIGNPGTTTGTYTLTVTVTPSSGTPQSQAITVNVQ
jgi:trimeric autotransporter adhesin